MNKVSDFLLTFCIPTYNRCELLKCVLDNLLEILTAYNNVEVLVCDNASTDRTREMVAHYIQQGQIRYIVQDENRGFDWNVISAMKAARGKYCWLLGDASIIDKSKIVTLIEQLDTNEFSAYIVNVASRVQNRKDKLYTNVNELLVELGWHCTQMSALVLNRRLLDYNIFQRYVGSGFIHVGILFDGLAMEEKISVQWDSQNMMKEIPMDLKKGNWYPQKVWAIFMKDWVDVILSLPMKYDLKNKLTCIKQHNRLTKIFAFKALLFQRANGAFDIQQYQKYSAYVRYTNPSRWYCLELFCIAVFPKTILRIFGKFYISFLKK